MVAETSPLYQSEANERPAFASPTSIQTTSSIASSRPQQTLIAPLSGRYHSWRYLGQLFTCYLLFEGEGKFFVVDMHAAHERLNYNRLRSLVSSRSETRTQGLLLPHLVRLSPGQLGELSNVDRHLKDLGYDWQIHADGIELLSVPSLLIRVDHERLIRNVTDKETYGGFPFPIEETIAYICARLACHASIRSGHILGATEAYALLNQDGIPLTSQPRVPTVDRVCWSYQNRRSNLGSAGIDSLDSEQRQSCSVLWCLKNGRTYPYYRGSHRSR